MEDIDFTSYQKVTTALADDLKLLVKAENGGAKINPSISVHPIVKPAAQPAKKQWPNQYNGYSGDSGYKNGNGNRNRCRGDRGQGNGNNNANGCGQSSPGSEQNFFRDPELSRKRGDLVTCPGFVDYLEHYTEAIHCSDSTEKGLVCRGVGWMLKHLTIKIGPA